MTQISIKYAELHNPLFLGGTNHQTKLDPSKRQGLKLTYDRAEKELIVEFNGHVALIPTSNVASLSLSDPADIGLKVASKPVTEPKTHVSYPMTAGIDRAQVSDPTRDPVFAAQPGQTGQNFMTSKVK